MFEVDTVFEEHQGSSNLTFFSHNATVEVLIIHLSSYDGWGMAQATCSSGCRCQPSKIDASIKEQVSKFATHAVGIEEPSKSCQMTLEILPETSSGGHKFKLSKATTLVSYKPATHH